MFFLAVRPIKTSNFAILDSALFGMFLRIKMSFFVFGVVLNAGSFFLIPIASNAYKFIDPYHGRHWFFRSYFRPDDARTFQPEAPGGIFEG